MYVLVRILFDECAGEYHDCILVESETFATLKEAQDQMNRELRKFVEESTSQLEKDFPDVDIDGPWMQEADETGEGEYQCSAMSAWLAYPEHRKWQIIKAE